MPSFGPTLRQTTTRGDGSITSLHNVGSTIQIPSGMPNGHLVAPLVTYSTNSASHQLYGIHCPAQSNLSINLGNLGAFHSIIDGYENTRNISGDLDVAPVDHIRVSSLTSALESWRTECGAHFVNQTATPTGNWLPGLDRSALLKAIEMPPSSVLRPLCDEAYNRFHTMFPEELSVANFIYELREISSLMPKLSKSLRKTAAGGFLNIEFGWKPLLGDLRTMFNVLDRVDARIQYLKSRYQKPTRGGYAASISWKPSGVPGYVTNLGPINGFGLRYVITSYEAKFNAGARILHSIAELDSLSSYVRALIFTFGFGNPAKIAWNMVPYSFVAGWFSNIEGLIDRYGNLQQVATDWQVDRMTHSVKVVSNIDVYQRNVSGSNALYWEKRRGSFQVSRYRRYVGLSVSDAILTASDPSTKQTALLAALVAGRNY